MSESKAHLRIMKAEEMKRDALETLAKVSALLKDGAHVVSTKTSENYDPRERFWAGHQNRPMARRLTIEIEYYQPVKRKPRPRRHD